MISLRVDIISIYCISHALLLSSFAINLEETRFVKELWEELGDSRSQEITLWENDMVSFLDKRA